MASEGVHHKPNTIGNEQTAPLIEWLCKYPVTRTNPKAWFAGQSFSLDELALTAAAGYGDVAAAFGYHPPHDYGVMVVNISPQAALEAA